MTDIQAFTTGTAALLDLDPYRFPAALVDDVPERTSSVGGRVESGDCLLSASEPTGRPSAPLKPVDRRRLELQATLTTAGIAPLPGDLDAIEALCQLTDTTHAALRRWISHAM
ncbi:hypothetical protein ACH4ZU_08780 [Streptomyces sp. NPDC020472]|uniref:hypothetical protein n=1 Tax=Streptomyces sp. NPDC020472 TaxID=3365075 RepID=UPI00378A5BFE